MTIKGLNFFFVKKNEIILALACKIKNKYIYLHSQNGDLVAQLVEHLPFKERVLGSSPSQITTTKKDSF
jgi:hypothetical protein